MHVILLVVGFIGTALLIVNCINDGVSFEPTTKPDPLDPMTAWVIIGVLIFVWILVVVIICIRFQKKQKDVAKGRAMALKIKVNDAIRQIEIAEPIKSKAVTRSAITIALFENFVSRKNEMDKIYQTVITTTDEENLFKAAKNDVIQFLQLCNLVRTVAVDMGVECADLGQRNSPSPSKVSDFQRTVAVIEDTDTDNDSAGPSSVMTVRNSPSEDTD